MNLLLSKLIKGDIGMEAVSHEAGKWTGEVVKPPGFVSREKIYQNTDWAYNYL